jgi:hypothetical protein
VATTTKPGKQTGAQSSKDLTRQGGFMSISSRISNSTLYVVSAIVIVALLAVFKPSVAVVGVYWCVSFWLLALVQAVVSKGDTSSVSVNYSLVDFIIGYVFAAPFILPARLYVLLSGR